MLWGSRPHSYGEVRGLDTLGLKRRWAGTNCKTDICLCSIVKKGGIRKNYPLSLVRETKRIFAALTSP